MPEILIYDEIGYWGITASDFAKELKALGDVSEITIGINSPGGQIDDGAAIYNLCKQHPANITMRVDGAAWSCATLIAMAGDKIQIAENATFMVHGPRAGAMQDTIAGHEEAIAVLKRFETLLIDVYVARTGLDKGLVESWMKTDNWFSASEALEAGLVDEVLSNKVLAAARFEPALESNHKWWSKVEPKEEESDDEDETPLALSDLQRSMMLSAIDLDAE